jgi:2-phosphoglycolate phosphatase
MINCEDDIKIGLSMTVLFDLDGTLLDTAPDFAFSINQLRSEQDLPPIELSVLRPAVSHGLSELMRVSFNVTAEHPRYAPLSSRLLEIYEQYLNQFTQPFAGILNLLSMLEKHNIGWGVVTNRLSRFSIPLLTSMNLIERARCVVSGDTTPHPKPHPAPLLYACEQIGVNPNECIYIGDAERDIIAGKAAGMATIGALFGYIDDVPSALQWGADQYVHHADEILPWVLAWHKQ